MAKSKKTIDFTGELFDVYLPNNLDMTNRNKLSLSEIKKDLENRIYNLKIQDLEVMVEIDMRVEKSPYGVNFVYEFGLRTKLYGELYFPKRKNEAFTIRRKFDSPTDANALVLLELFNSIQPA